MLVWNEQTDRRRGGGEEDRAGGLSEVRKQRGGERDKRQRERE